MYENKKILKISATITAIASFLYMYCKNNYKKNIEEENIKKNNMTPVNISTTTPLCLKCLSNNFKDKDVKKTNKTLSILSKTSPEDDCSPEIKPSNNNEHDELVMIMQPENWEKMLSRLGHINSDVTSVIVKAPAVVALIGSKYGCVGLALDLWLEVEISKSDKFNFEFNGVSKDDIPKDNKNDICIAVEKSFEDMHLPVPNLSYKCNNNIPSGVGLGLASASTVVGVVAGSILSGAFRKYGKDIHKPLLKMCSKIKSRVDTVAPSIYGGFRIVLHNGKDWMTDYLPTSTKLRGILFIPDEDSLTKSDFQIPENIMFSREELAFNIGHVAYLIHGIALNCSDNLRWGIEGNPVVRHLPKSSFNYLDKMSQSCIDKGAICCFLAGDGPTIIALINGTKEEAIKIENAMIETASSLNVKGKTISTIPALKGASVMESQY